METLAPYKIIEWIPYNNLQNIKYLTKGGCFEIYTAEWIGRWYFNQDSNEQQLKRCGTRRVILKRLVNRSWFEAVCNLKDNKLIYILKKKLIIISIL